MNVGFYPNTTLTHVFDQQIPKLFNYEHLNEQNLECVKKRLCQNFVEHETMGKALKLSDNNLDSLFYPMVPHCLEHSFVAADEKGKVVGALIAHDYLFFKSLPAPQDPPPKVQAIISLLSKLEEHFEQTFYLEQNMFMYQYAVYVEEESKGNGIAGKLLKMSEEHAKKMGYKFIVTIATGPVTQKIFKKMDFLKITEISYPEFIFEGKHVFSELDKTDCVLFVKDLSRVYGKL